MGRFATAAAVTGGAAATAVAAALITGRTRAEGGPASVAEPPAGLPPGRVIAVPGHGEMFLRDQAGPPGGPTILLVHGWVATADLNWFTVYEGLAGSGRVLAPDHRGHGRGARHSAPFRLADVADDLAAMIRELGTGPVIVVGYSMGGPITQLLWQRHPDVVAGIVLCATASHFRFSVVTSLAWRGMVVYQFGSRLLPRSWLERVLTIQTSGSARVRLVQSITPESIALGPVLPWAVGEIKRGDVEDLAEAGRELGRFDSRGWIRGVDVPAAVVVTTRDRMVPPNAQLELAALLPDPLLLEVAADHDAPTAAGAALTAAIVAAVEDFETRGDRGAARVEVSVG